MAWITLTETDVLSSLPESERDLYVNFEDGDEDTLAEILEDTVAMVRSKVKACDENIPDPDETTIPKECRQAALAIVRFELMARIDAEDAGESLRVKAYDKAIRFLDSVAACGASISPGASTTKTSVQVISSQTRITGRDKLSGL